MLLKDFIVTGAFEESLSEKYYRFIKFESLPGAFSTACAIKWGRNPHAHAPLLAVGWLISVFYRKILSSMFY